ncbi:MAG TPA: UDP binding domain-containing protein, partial [Segetibacter sp.]
KVIQHVIANSDNVKEAKVLVMGATFKENVSDIRNSKVIDVIKTLKSYYLNVFVHDPFASSDQLEEEYGIKLTKDLDDDYDVVMVSVPHAPYIHYDDAFFSSITKKHALIADLKGTFRNKITSRKYWSL